MRWECCFCLIFAMFYVNNYVVQNLLVREPAILLIKWLRPKGLKVCSYVERYADFKNQTLKKIGWYTKMLRATEYPRGRQFLKLALKWGTLYHIIYFDLPCIPRTILHWCQMLTWDTMNEKKCL